jgi:hypothetical protein
LPEDDENEEDQDIFDHKTHVTIAGVGKPEFLSVLGFSDCLDKQKPNPTSIFKAWCLPINRPTNCSMNSWKELNDDDNGPINCPQTDSKNNTTTTPDNDDDDDDRRNRNSKLMRTPNKRQSEATKENIDETTTESVTNSSETLAFGSIIARR